MTSLVGFPLETVYRITNITNSYPCIVTLLEIERDYAFSISNEQTISIRNVSGMIELNFNRYIIQGLDSDTKSFSLYDIEGFPIDSTIFHPYISDGEVDIISYPGTPPGLMYNNQ